MKNLTLLLFFLLPLFNFSQELLLLNIIIPGEEKISEQKNILIMENIQGPKKILLAAEYLKRHEEISASTSSFKQDKIDELNTTYSGVIYSPGIIEPFVFENKKPEELNLLEALVFPNYLEQPYSLYLNLIVKVSSKKIKHELSDDSGIYNANLIISIREIN